VIPLLSSTERRIALAALAAMKRAAIEGYASRLDREIATDESVLSRSVGVMFRANLAARIDRTRRELDEVIAELDALDAPDLRRAA
jgi:hypothetical protein